MSAGSTGPRGTRASDPPAHAPTAMTAPSSPTFHRPRRVEPRVLWLTAGAVLLYGAIAALANRHHGVGSMGRAALVQGLSCGVTTFGLSTLMDSVGARLSRRPMHPHAATLLAALTAIVLGFSLHLTANLLAGTPELAATVAVPTLALAIYCPLYAAAAVRRQLQPVPTEAPEFTRPPRRVRAMTRPATAARTERAACLEPSAPLARLPGEPHP